MHKWAMAALLITASVMGIVYTIETIVVAERERVDEIVQDNELRFLASNFQFDQEEYHVQVGETLELTMRNEQGRHGVGIEGLDINLVEGDTVEYTFTEPGTYDVVCTIACGEGHAEMNAKLIVSEASAQEDNQEQEAAH
jgi:cytochrome c oxidase subunit 2